MSITKYSFLFLLHSLLLQTTDCIKSSKLTKWARWNETNVTFGTPIGVEKSVSLKTCFVKCQEIPGCLSTHFNETNSTCEFSAYYPPARTVLSTPRTGWTVYHMILACNVYNPCQNGGTCHDGSYSSTCSCVAGYTGKSCETNINECVSHPCLNGGTCIDGISSYTCSCVDGYMGANCQTNFLEAKGYGAYQKPKAADCVPWNAFDGILTEFLCPVDGCGCLCVSTVYNALPDSYWVMSWLTLPNYVQAVTIYFAVGSTAYPNRNTGFSIFLHDSWNSAIARENGILCATYTGAPITSSDNPISFKCPQVVNHNALRIQDLKPAPETGLNFCEVKVFYTQQI